VNKLEAFGYIVAQAERGEIVFPTSVNAVVRLQRALEDPDCHLDDAILLVLSDPQLAARTVALANSVAFGGTGGAPVTNVRAAVTRVGYQRLRAMVAALMVRQFGVHLNDPLLRSKVAQLWEHTAYVAVLAQAFARRITFVNPDTALFAGIVHEVGGFYLLSRADQFPGLLDDDPERWGQLCEDVVGREVLRKLAVPEPVTEAVLQMRDGWLNMPPQTLRDTLLLANQYAPVPSPLGSNAPPLPRHQDSVLDFVVDEPTLNEILIEAGEAYNSMHEPLMA
jgi:HD-like signal output (HDOD) protein